MNTLEATDLKIYEVTNRQSGEKSYQASTNAQDACKQAGWVIGDCYVNQQKPKSHYNDIGHLEGRVKIPCLICPFQYAECKKPATEECPSRPSAPDLQAWLAQAAKAHLCPHVGVTLTKKDHQLWQKWVNLKDAVKELAAKAFSPTDKPPQ